MKVGVIDVGLGNVTAVKRMVQKVGGEPVSVIDPSNLIDLPKIILPGVGHFNEGMRRLLNTGLDAAIKKTAENKAVKVLGICLGMQLLCKSSEEGNDNGLGIVDANVVKISPNIENRIKVPHMGWNSIKVCRNNPLFDDQSEQKRFYFVHSYKVVPVKPKIMVASTHYGDDFCSVYQQSNVFGVQFHPEKSHRFGMEMMNKFVDL